MVQALSLSGIVLPRGFGFRPTNEELINHYLKPKITGDHSDEDSFIVTIDDPRKYDPSELPMYCSKPWYHSIYLYFFCKWNQYGKGNRFDRVTKTGFWKKTGKELKINDPETDEVIGKRSIFVFYRAHPATKTDYIMHLFEMTNQPSDQSLSYVLCRVHENPTKRKKNKFDTPNNAEGEPSGDITPSYFEMPIPPATISWVAENGIGEQSNGSLSQSPDVTFFEGLECGVSFGDNSNGNTPLATAETQAEYDQAGVKYDSLMYSQPLYSSKGFEVQALSGVDESIEDMLKGFYVPEDLPSKTIASIFRREPEDNEGVDGKVGFTSSAPGMSL